MPVHIRDGKPIPLCNGDSYVFVDCWVCGMESKMFRERDGSLIFGDPVVESFPQNLCPNCKTPLLWSEEKSVA